MGLENENIYHYYYKPPGPFKSITELKKSEADEVVKNISQKTSIHHTRLTDFPDYINHRRSTEKIMRSQFIEAGGKPERETPFYCILGNEVSYQNDNPGSSVIAIDPENIPDDQLSFTFCDSMIAFPFVPFFSPEGYNFTYIRKPFHQRLFHFDELKNTLAIYGHPNDPKNHFLPFPGFIEVQLWCNVKLDHSDSG